MQTTKLVLPSAVLVAGLTVFAATAVTAAEPLSPAALQPPPRECTLKGFWGGSVKIQAGPDLNTSGGLAAAFPLSDDCPGEFGPGLCKKWVYRWIFTDMQGTAAAVSIDSDIAVLTANPAAQVVPILPFFGKGERFIKFDLPKVTTFTGTYWTAPDVGPGTLTAGYAGTKGLGHCPLAGADNLIPEENQAVDQVVQSELRSETGQILCTVERTIDAFGRTGNIVVTSGDCTRIGEFQLRTAGTNGQPGAALFIKGDVQITFGGSHKFCWASTTTGQMTCVQTPPHP